MRSRLARCRSRVRLRVDAFCKKILRYWRFFSSNRDTSHFPPWTGPKWPGPKWPARNSPAQNAQARNGKKLLFFVLQQLSRERCFNYECDPKPKVCRTKTLSVALNQKNSVKMWWQQRCPEGNVDDPKQNRINVPKIVNLFSGVKCAKLKITCFITELLGLHCAI